MGTLTLPTTGPIYLDASGFIYSVERIEPYHTLLAPLWHQAQAGQFVIVSNELVVLETLVKPLREGDTVLAQLFRALLHAREVQLIPATLALWEHAARLRAHTGLKTPDALHAATALDVASTLCITNDRDFRRVEGLPVVVLDDLLGEEGRDES
jgi:predicted nucleic acid-binding protein